MVVKMYEEGKGIFAGGQALKTLPRVAPMIGAEGVRKDGRKHD